MEPEFVRVPYQMPAFKKPQKTSASNSQSQLEDQIDIRKSNYQLFLEKWNNDCKYALPDSFKLLRVGDCTKQKVGTEYEWFNFSILSYSCDQLHEVSSKILKSSGFEAYCSPEALKKLVYGICQGYNVVSYHNFSHAFSLMHMFFQLTKLDVSFKKMFTNEEIGYCLIAALAHDLKHPGTNNAYEVKLKSQLAMESSNQSVLERMHIKELFQIIKENQIDIFEKSTNPKQMKQLIIQAILSTDVSKHFKNLEHLKELLDLKRQGEPEGQVQRYFYMEQAFHACDIGNPCLQFQEYMNWAALLTYEFNTQTLMEESHNVEITEMLRYKSLKSFYKGQIGFINYLAYPLWKQLSGYWTGFQLLVENIDTNLKLLQIKANNEKDD